MHPDLRPWFLMLAFADGSENCQASEDFSQANTEPETEDNLTRVSSFSAGVESRAS